MILAYTLSLFPMLLITLAVHELGHLAMARINRVKPNRFQIGIGKNLITRYTGRTKIIITPETEKLNGLSAGETTDVYVTRKPGEEEYTAGAIIPLRERTGDEALEAMEVHRRYRDSHMKLTGRIRQTSPGEITLADMAWSLQAVPIMAGVHFPDDPSMTMPEAYNTARWRRQVSITLAGPMANILAMVIILALVAALLPQASPPETVWEFTWVEPGGSADQAGIKAGDRIVRMEEKTHPTQEDLQGKIRQAQNQGKSLLMEVSRDGRNLVVQAEGIAARGRLGVYLTPLEQTERKTSMHPQAMADRMGWMAQRYTKTIGSMVKKALSREERMEVVQGPVISTYRAAAVVEGAGAWGWMVILATLNLGVAVSNMIPMPPQDGYRVIAETAQAIRKGKPVSPRVERAMFIGGSSIIMGITAYLITWDIMRLMQ